MTSYQSLGRSILRAGISDRQYFLSTVLLLNRISLTLCSPGVREKQCVTNADCRLAEWQVNEVNIATLNLVGSSRKFINYYVVYN